ncbi:MAG: beta-propeller fold lactonase family protein [Bacteroidales bacterium]|nr:beta-propeller fold lactonase family protein [Bacteroidales bacterium]
MVHPNIGEKVVSDDGKLTIQLVGKRQNYGGSADTRDEAINSPKSVHIHPNGKKYYVNSLEGGTTVVFESETNRKLKVVKHNFSTAHDKLWSTPSPLYPFTHYPKNNHFMGKPVESTFSHNGRYLWVPYYRRSYDINAQDPSALAVIDTETDEIVKLMETGPLPKMIATSRDGKTIAVAHWGNNTVGLIDISSPNPNEWKHEACIVIDHVLPLNYSLTTPVDRDNGSGYALRGTVFTPDNKYLLVGCMGGGGGIAVINLAEKKYMGRLTGMMPNVRHLIISGDYLYLSINAKGYVQRIPWRTFVEEAQALNASKRSAVVAADKWTNCKVGTGARTIQATPDGQYIFAACNTSSKLCVVDTKSMKMIGSINVDSYPVGLDVSADGHFVYTTSQGRSHHGGNAVDIFTVDYKALPVPKDSTATDTAATTPPACADGKDAAEASDSFPWIPCCAGGGAILLCGGIWWGLSKRH